MKIGKSTKFSAGTISKTKASICHENFGRNVMAGQTKQRIVDKGDKGSFMLNRAGQVMALLIGVVKWKAAELYSHLKFTLESKIFYSGAVARVARK
jgi:hypothetical protein